jgi:hypothetical protein
MATKKAKTRGSKKLSSTKTAAAQSSLAARIKALGKGALSNDIIINGSPQPDAFKGSLTVKASSAGGVLNQLLKIPGAQYKPVQLFPKGQPPAIDQILIKVDAKIR